jgi:hypothetical protein
MRPTDLVTSGLSLAGSNGAIGSPGDYFPSTSIITRTMPRSRATLPELKAGAKSERERMELHLLLMLPSEMVP